MNARRSSARVAVIIPARFQSSRFPGKPLAPLRGSTGISKPLIQRSWECAMRVKGVSSVWVATDDERIADVVKNFGGQVVMTSVDCANGTERCADALRKLGEIADIVVNVQGDAPLTPPKVVEHLVEALESDPQAIMATPAIRCTKSVLSHLLTDQAAGRVGGTTVVFGDRGYAYYFSKSVIPYVPAKMCEQDFPPVHLHLGVYAYRLCALDAYMNLPVSNLEQLEGLEQLRFLDAGQNIRIVSFDPLEWDSIELNNPTDISTIEAILAKNGMV